MLKPIKEFGKYVAIAGFRDAKIPDVEKFLGTVRRAVELGVEVQFFDAGLVATWQHLYFASLNALKAFKNGENISKSLAVETVLYASAQHQIRRAVELVGVKRGSAEIAVLAIGEDAEKVNSAISIIETLINAQRDDTVLLLSEKKIKALQKVFEISDIEIGAVIQQGNLEKAINDVILERMALISTRR